MSSEPALPAADEEPGAAAPGPAAPSLSRIEIFVDGSNFHPSLAESGIPHPVDYGKLAANLCGPGEGLVGLHYVSGAFPAPRDNRPGAAPGEYAQRLARYNSTEALFRRIAQEPGVRVWKEQYIYRTPDASDPRPVIEKGTDVRVALLMYEGARDNRYDHAILVASDADYAPAVSMVCALGKTVTWAFTSSHAKLKALVRAGARPRELTPAFLDSCRYVPKVPTGGLAGAARHV